MRALFHPDAESQSAADEFASWLIETCVSDGLSANERESRLIDWRGAPGGVACHPREEHLLPLHVCFGAAIEDSPLATVDFDEVLLGHRTIGLSWH